MNIVYKFIFVDRIENKSPPYYYIGSKTNCTVKDGKIYDLKSGKVYVGSSRHKDYPKNEVAILEILGEYKLDILLEKEKQFQLEVSAKTNPEYFNLEYATISNYCKSGYANYKHIISGKVIRLHKDDPIIKSGEYVGIHKGRKLNKDHVDKVRIANSGKKRSKEQSEYLSICRKGIKKSESHRLKIAQSKIGKTTGPKSEDCKKKISESNKQSKRTAEWWKSPIYEDLFGIWKDNSMPKQGRFATIIKSHGYNYTHQQMSKLILDFTDKIN